MARALDAVMQITINQVMKQVRMLQTGSDKFIIDFSSACHPVGILAVPKNWMSDSCLLAFGQM